MKISTGLRNRAVGFTLICTIAVLILPLLLSRDVLKRENPDAYGVNAGGGVYDSNGNLIKQPSPDYNSVIGFGSAQNSASGADLQISSVAGEQTETEELSFESTDTKEESGVSSEVLEFESAPVVSAPVAVSKPASTESNRSEELTFTAANNRPAAKPVQAAPVKEKTTASSSSATGSVGRYTVQVGVFSVKSNADNLVKKIKAAGIHSYISESHSNSGKTLYRVYAGGSDNRNDLESVLNKVNAISRSKGRIVTRP